MFLQKMPFLCQFHRKSRLSTGGGMLSRLSVSGYVRVCMIVRTSLFFCWGGVDNATQNLFFSLLVSIFAQNIYTKSL